MTAAGRTGVYKCRCSTNWLRYRGRNALLALRMICVFGGGGGCSWLNCDVCVCVWVGVGCVF